jgi:hypothetical protein
MDFMWQITMLPYGDEWRAKRRLMHAHVHQGVAGQYHDVQLAAARRLARNILATPADDVEALPRAVKLNFGQSIIKMVYGIDVPDSDSEYISLPEAILAAFSQAVIPGRYLINFIPASMCVFHHHPFAQCFLNAHSEVYSGVVPRRALPAVRARDPG